NEDPVPHDRAANFPADSILIVTHNGLAAENGFDRIQLALVQIVIDTTMPRVRPIDQKRIHLAAGSMAELWVLLALHQREIGYRFIRNGHQRTRQSLIVIVCSVHVEIVTRVRLPANGRSNTGLENRTRSYSLAEQREVIGSEEFAILIN